MTTILAIDTATDACSVALYSDGQYSDLYEVIPRQHSRRLMPMLEELIGCGDLRAQGVDAIAYGSGPGSFTGLRIAASAVQGLAYANKLPAIPVSTLSCQVQTALRLGVLGRDDVVLSMLDARINEVYWSSVSLEDGRIVSEQPAVVCAPSEVCDDGEAASLKGVGSGFNYLSELPEGIRGRLRSVFVDVLPSARDLIPQALEKFANGEVQRANEVLPVYVRDEVSWKKLADQGKRQ
jgi:tRNA threonylcarbamoyladenosine biosynthesis protein TsaB